MRAGYDRPVSDDDGLFVLADNAPGSAPESPPAPIQAWQVEQVRTALDAAGATSMIERQALIEEIVGRPVAALRDLHFADVRELLESLHDRKTPNQSRIGSAWDQRDEDTWIDRI